MTCPRRLATAALIVALAAGGGLVGAKAWHDHERARPADRWAFLSGAVRFDLPPRWLVQGWLRDDHAEGVAAFIPCVALEDTPHSANANLLVEANDDGEALASWAARRLRVAAPRRIEQQRTEAAWRTVVSTGEDRGARYVVVERFGVSPQGRVHAVAAFPALEAAGEAWLDRTTVEIDRFFASLALAGAAPSTVHVAWDGRTVRLAAILAAADGGAP